MDNETFDQGMALLMTTFQGLKADTKILKFWRLLLSDLDSQVFLHAIIKICRNTREIYPGTNIVAMIHQECRQSVDSTPFAEEAWLEGLKATKQGRGSKVPEFSNTFIAKAVEIVGWEAIWWSFDNSEKRSIQRAHFIKAYKAYQDREEDLQVRI